MNSIYCIVFFLIVAAVVPEVINGATASAEAVANFSDRQVTGCSGRCFGRVRNANRDCRIGIRAGSVCRVQRCNRGRRNPGFQCIFVGPAPPSPLPPRPPIGTCPNRCFAPGMPSMGTMQAAVSAAQADCLNRGPTCVVRACSASPQNGFSCSQPCPNVCRASPAVAAMDCAASVRCFVQPCTLPTGGIGSSCTTPTGVTVSTVTASMATPSASPSMSPGASASVTASVTPSPAATPSVTSSPSPSPTVTVSATPSPNCEFSIGAIGTAPATAFCRCGTTTRMVSVPAAVDDAGMALTQANEMSGLTAYTTCVVRDLGALCNPNGIDTFQTAGATAVTNCCAGSVVDGMGLNTATNQCRIGDGCGPISTIGTTQLVMAGQMITCTCSGMTANAPVLPLVATAGTAITVLTATQGDNADDYNTCLQNSLSALCTSSGFANFATAGTAAVSTCCTTAQPGGAAGAAAADCAIGA